jgi:hypothetical protein
MRLFAGLTNTGISQELERRAIETETEESLLMKLGHPSTQVIYGGLHDCGHSLLQRKVRIRRVYQGMSYYEVN